MPEIIYKPSNKLNARRYLMEGITSFAFAGLFSMTLLSLTFSFQLGIRFRNMSTKLEVMEGQLDKRRDTDRMIIDEINAVVRVMQESVRPVLQRT